MEEHVLLLIVTRMAVAEEMEEMLTEEMEEMLTEEMEEMLTVTAADCSIEQLYLLEAMKVRIARSIVVRLENPS
jgi:hypothetical protein